MSRANEFRELLYDLFYRRAYEVLHQLDGYPPGAPPAYDRRAVTAAIADLLRLASEHHGPRLARKEFEESVEHRKSWHAKRGKGRGVDPKKEAFKKWYAQHFRPSSACVYAFWSGRICEYVGKTGARGTRPVAHFEKFWFGAVTRIDVYKARGMRPLPALECLGIHWFQPRRNKSKAETRKWLKRCPLCAGHKALEADIRALFPAR